MAEISWIAVGLGVFTVVAVIIPNIIMIMKKPRKWYE